VILACHWAVAGSRLSSKDRLFKVRSMSLQETNTAKHFISIKFTLMGKSHERQRKIIINSSYFNTDCIIIRANKHWSLFRFPNSNTYKFVSSTHKVRYREIQGIHKSLTQFTKSVHLNGGKDYNMRRTDGKRNSPKFYLHTSQVLCVSALCDTADVKPIIRLRPYPLQLLAIDFWDGRDHLSSYPRQILL
jgi:hypothetical protein